MGFILVRSGSDVLQMGDSAVLYRKKKQHEWEKISGLITLGDIVMGIVSFPRHLKVEATG